MNQFKVINEFSNFKVRKRSTPFRKMTKSQSSFMIKDLLTPEVTDTTYNSTSREEDLREYFSEIGMLFGLIFSFTGLLSILFTRIYANFPVILSLLLLLILISENAC